MGEGIEAVDSMELQEATKEAGLTQDEALKYLKHGKEMEGMLERARVWVVERLQGETYHEDTSLPSDLYSFVNKLNEGE
jgi:hypothetical protein